MLIAALALFAIAAECAPLEFGGEFEDFQQTLNDIQELSETEPEDMESMLDEADAEGDEDEDEDDDTPADDDSNVAAEDEDLMEQQRAQQAHEEDA